MSTILSLRSVVAQLCVIVTCTFGGEEGLSKANRLNDTFYGSVWREMVRESRRGEMRYCLEKVVADASARTRQPVKPLQTEDAAALEAVLESHGMEVIRNGKVVVFRTPEASLTDHGNPLNQRVRDFSYKGKIRWLFTAKPFQPNDRCIWMPSAHSEDIDADIELTLPGYATLRQVFLQLTNRYGIIWFFTVTQAETEKDGIIMTVQFRDVSASDAP